LKSKGFASVNLNALHKPVVATPATAGAKPPPKGLVALTLQPKDKKNANQKFAPPMPVQLKSLKAENHGHDPGVSLVPSGGLGWGKKADAAPPEPKAAGVASEAAPKAPLRPKGESEKEVKSPVEVSRDAKEVRTSTTQGSAPPWVGGWKSSKNEGSAPSSAHVGRVKDTQKDYPTLAREEAGDAETSPRQRSPPRESTSSRPPSRPVATAVKKGPSWADQEHDSDSADERPLRVTRSAASDASARAEKEREKAKDKDEAGDQDIKSFMREKALRRAAERKSEQEEEVAQQKARAQEKLRELDERNAARRKQREEEHPDASRSEAPPARSPRADDGGDWEAEAERRDAREEADKAAAAKRAAREEADPTVSKRSDSKLIKLELGKPKPSADAKSKAEAKPGPSGGKGVPENPVQAGPPKGWQTSPVKAVSDEKLAGSFEFPKLGEKVPEGMKPTKPSLEASQKAYEESLRDTPAAQARAAESAQQQEEFGGPQGKGKKGKGKGKEWEKGKGKDWEKGKGKDWEKGNGKDWEKGNGRDWEKGGKGKDWQKGGKGKDWEKGVKGKDRREAGGFDEAPAARRDATHISSTQEEEAGVAEEAAGTEEAEVPKWQQRPSKPTRGDWDNDWRKRDDDGQAKSLQEDSRKGAKGGTDGSAQPGSSSPEGEDETAEAGRGKGRHDWADWKEGDESFDEKGGKGKGKEKGKKGKKSKGKGAYDEESEQPEKDTTDEDGGKKGKGKKGKGKGKEWETAAEDEGKGKGKKGKNEGKKGKEKGAARWVVKDAQQDAGEENGWEQSSWKKSDLKSSWENKENDKSRGSRYADTNGDTTTASIPKMAMPPQPPVAPPSPPQAETVPNRQVSAPKASPRPAETQKPKEPRRPAAAPNVPLASPQLEPQKPKEVDERVRAMLHAVDGQIAIGAGVVCVQGEDPDSDEDSDAEEFMTVKSKKQQKAEKADKKRIADVEAKKAKRDAKFNLRKEAEEAARSLKIAAEKGEVDTAKQGAEGVQDAAQEAAFEAANSRALAASSGEKLRGEVSERVNESAGGASGSGSIPGLGGPVPAAPSNAFHSFGPFGPIGPTASQPPVEIGAIWDRAPGYVPGYGPPLGGPPNHPALSSGIGGMRRPLRPIGRPPPYAPPRLLKPLLRRLPLHSPSVTEAASASQFLLNPIREPRSVDQVIAEPEANFAPSSASTPSRRPQDAPPPPPPPPVAAAPDTIPSETHKGDGSRFADRPGGRFGERRDWGVVTSDANRKSGDAEDYDHVPQRTGGKSFYYAEKGSKRSSKGKGKDSEDSEWKGKDREWKGKDREWKDSDDSKGKGKDKDRGSAQSRSYYPSQGGGRAAARDTYGREASTSWEVSSAPRGRARGGGKGSHGASWESSDWRSGSGGGGKAADDWSRGTKGADVASGGGAKEYASTGRGRGRGKGVVPTLTENTRVEKSQGSSAGRGKMVYRPKVPQESS